MTRGGNQQKIFHLLKVDGEQSGSQNWRKTSKFLGKKYIHLNDNSPTESILSIYSLGSTV